MGIDLVIDSNEPGLDGVGRPPAPQGGGAGGRGGGAANLALVGGVAALLYRRNAARGVLCDVVAAALVGGALGASTLALAS